MPANKETSGNPGNSPAASPSERFHVVCSIAGGLLYQDGLMLVVAWLILAIPALFTSLLQSGSQNLDSVFILELLDRALELTFLFYVTRRWLTRFKAPTHHPLRLARSYITLLSVGFMFWFLFSVPRLVLVTGVHQGVKAAFVAMLLPAAFISFRYFMYFFPVSLGVPGIRESLSITTGFLTTDHILPFRLLAAPIGFSALLTGIIRLPAPDGRLRFIEGVFALSAPAFWVLCAYLSIAAALYCLDDLNWKRFSLEPYRQARLTTLIVQSPVWLGKLLRPKTGLIMLLIGTLVWAGNMQRLATMAPQVEIKVQEIRISESSVFLTLDLYDAEHKLSGFIPSDLALAGQSRQDTLSAHPKSVTLKNDGSFIYFTLPRKDHAVIELEFETNRPQDSLVALEDVYLWYRYARLSLLNFKGASLAQALTPGA